MRQAQTINRMAAAAEDRNEVDANRHAYTEARIAQLEAALRKHGRHDSDCFKFSAMDTYRECTCGFDAALRPAEPPANDTDEFAYGAAFGEARGQREPGKGGET